MFYGGVIGMIDVIYFGWFDIVMMSNILNLVYLVLIIKEEYFVMFEWSIG